MRKLSEKKIKNRVLYSINFAENGVLYEIMWENMDDVDRPQTTIHCGAEKMRFACRMTKARTHKHTIITFNTYCLSTATMVR